MKVPLALRVLLALATAKLVGGIAGFFFGSPEPTPFPPWIHLAHLVVFGSVAALLVFGGRGDLRALYLGSSFLVFASVFADRLLFGLARGAASPAAQLTTGLGHLRLEAFWPCLVWLFFRDFPKAPDAGRGDRFSRWAALLSGWTGVALVAANPPWLAPAGRSGPVWTWILSRDGYYWTIVILLVLPALPFALWRARTAPVRERRRVGVFVAGLVLGAAPMLVDVLLEGLIPGFQTFMEANRRIAGFVLYPLVLLIPVTTAYAVLVHRVLDVHLIVRKAIQHALARSTVLVLAIVPFLGFVWYVYAHRDETITGLLSGGGPAVFVSLTLLALGVLRLRRRALQAIDSRFFREQYDSHLILAGLVEKVRVVANLEQLARLLKAEIDRALHLEGIAVLVADRSNDRFISLDQQVEPLPASSALSVLVGGNSEPLHVELEDPASPLRRLPEQERQWLAEGKFRLILPLIGSDASLVGLVALGQKRSELPFTREDRFLLESIAAAGALALENRLIRATTALAEVAADRTASINGATLPGDVSLARECGACHALHSSGAGACNSCGGAVYIVPVPYILLSKFRLEKQIGGGGMGIVYRARDTRLGRAVALKFLSPERALNTTARARFLREAQAASALDHPNIAAIYEIGDWNGQPFIAMAYYEGGTLKDRIRPGGMDCAEARAIVAQIASGLAAAHAAGIVHRDLKPANVALTGSGQVKILDFGLAKLKPPDEGTEGSLTEEGALLGTMMYMSPEQIRSKEADARSDLWALGILAYEILAGVHPFQIGSASDVCRRILEEAPIPLVQVRAGVPPALARLVEDLLQKEPSARIAKAEEVLRLLSAEY